MVTSNRGGNGAGASSSSSSTAAAVVAGRGRPSARRGREEDSSDAGINTPYQHPVNSFYWHY